MAHDYVGGRVHRTLRSIILDDADILLEGTHGDVRLVILVKLDLLKDEETAIQQVLLEV